MQSELYFQAVYMPWPTAGHLKQKPTDKDFPQNKTHGGLGLAHWSLLSDGFVYAPGINPSGAFQYNIRPC